MSGIRSHFEALNLNDADIKKLVELNLEMLVNNILKLSPMSFNENAQHNQKTRETLRMWALDTAIITIFNSNKPIEPTPPIETFYSLERMNIILSQLLNVPNEANKLLRMVDEIMTPKSSQQTLQIKDDNQIKEEQQIKYINCSTIIITTLAMIAQKL